MTVMRNVGAGGAEVRIGELAAWAGVTPRTVRHYHQVGLLPEPARSGGRYRQYGMLDLLYLLRIRRLVELGLSLGDVRQALDGPEPPPLEGILDELDSRLAAEQQRLGRQRREIAELRRGADDPAQLEDLLARVAVSVASDDADMALESQLLAGVGSLVGQSPAQVRDAVAEAMTDEDYLDRIREFVRRFADLVAVPPASPEVAALASDVSGSMLAPSATVGTTREGEPPAGSHALLEALRHQLPPAQARCLELMLSALTGRPS